MPEDVVLAAAEGGSGFAQRLRRTAKVVAREAAAAFARTPLEVLLGIAAAIGFSVAVEQDAMETWSHLLVAVGIALPLCYGASVLAVRGAIPGWLRWGVSGLAVAAGALYGFLVFSPDLEAEAWRAWLLVGAAFATLLCVPLIRPLPGDRREQLHRFVARLAFRVAVVMAYAGALWAGLALALAAVNGLFELHLDGKAWAHLAGVLFILLPPWAVAAGLPALLAPLESWGDAELKLFRRAGAMLLLPLVLVYLAIVYAYTVRVLVTGEVPKNLVSPVVIGAGLLIVLTTVALEPVHGDEEAAGLALLLRLASPLLLPLVLFAIWAVSTRVDQYGWTEFRFLRLLTLALLAAYGAAGLWRLLRRRRPPLTATPAVLAIVLLLAAVGPWSATAVARRSQAGELRQLLAKAGRTGAGEAPSAVPAATFRGITDKADYLRKHFGWAALGSVVPWIGADPGKKVGTADYARRLGIVERLDAGMTRVVNAHLKLEQGVPGVAGGTLFLFESDPSPRRGRPAPPPRTAAAASAAPGIAVTRDSVGGRLTVVPPGADTLVADLAPLMQALLARSATSTGSPIFERRSDQQPNVETGRALDAELTPADAVQPLRHRDGRVAGQLVLRHLEFESEPHGGGAVLKIRSVGGVALLAP